MKTITLLSLCLLLASQSAGAGVVYMKNGDQITGTIKKVWDGEVYIDPSYADEFSVKQAEIAYMDADSSRQFELELADGTPLVGSLAGADRDGNQLIMIDGQAKAIPMSTLAELKEPEKLFDWNASADLNSAFNSGNTNNHSVTLGMDFMLKKNKHTNFLDLLLQNEEQEIDGVTAQVQDSDRVRYNYNYAISDPWFLGSSASWERDSIKGLDSRYNVVPAAGYNFWDDAHRELGLQLGAGFQSEEVTDINGLTSNEDGAVAALLLRFRYKFANPDLELYLNNTTTAAFYGRKNVVTQFDFGTKYEITDLLYLNLQVLLDYESEPVEGAKSEDISLLFGFGLEFEK
jgi:putative salt-induced outer membrane protein YdiY